MSRSTYGYTRHILHVSQSGDCPSGLTAILPCQWSYGELAKPLVKSLPDDQIFADWISLFGNNDNSELVEETTSLLDRLVDVDNERRIDELAWIFDVSTRYEAQFWQMAYSGANWD